MKIYKYILIIGLLFLIPFSVVKGVSTLGVWQGGTGAGSFTDGGILLGSGTGALTAMSVLGSGAIVVGDGTTDPVALTAFTSSTGTLKHEVGGIEADISAVVIGDILSGSGEGTIALVTATGHSDGDVLTLQADGSVDYETFAAAGDVLSVGDCASGACLDGSADGGTYLYIYDGDSNYTSLVSSNVAATTAIVLPATAGTLVHSGIATLSSLTSVGTLTALTVDNININGSTISGVTTDANTIITAYATKAIVIESVSFDGGVVTGASSISSTGFTGALSGNATTATDTASKTGTGSTYATNTSPTFVTPLLGTPTSGTLTNCSFPTLNQNTTGSSGSCTGNSATVHRIYPSFRNITLSGADAVTITTTGATNSTLPLGTKTLVATDVATLSSLTSIGTIGTGTWEATDIAIAHGGTGSSTLAGASIPTYTSTNTFTNKRITKRTGTTTSSATPTINTDNVDFYSLTAQAEDITSFTTNLSGTPTENQTLWIAITGTAARAITWGTSFEASTIALPTTTVTTARLDAGFVWNTVTLKWRIVATM